MQISTPIEKLKRLQLAEEKSGISRLSIIPKCDTNFINDSDDFEVGLIVCCCCFVCLFVFYFTFLWLLFVSNIQPYVDSSPSHMKITTDLPSE